VIYRAGRASGGIGDGRAAFAGAISSDDFVIGYIPGARSASAGAAYGVPRRSDDVEDRCAGTAGAKADGIAVQLFLDVQPDYLVVVQFPAAPSLYV
jgi:hypothetical protein